MTFSQAATNKCPSGTTEYTVVGSVSGGNSTYTASGQPISADVCVTGTLSFSLLKKTSITL